MSRRLEELYTALEERFPPTDGSDYERLVVAQGNSAEPFHRWFHMKEAFSPYLLQRVIKDLGIQDSTVRIVDPCAGSGTTLVSAMTMPDGPDVSVTGAEINPFLQLLSETKVAVLSLSSPERIKLVHELRGAAKRVTASRPGRAPAAPKLSAFQNVSYFPPRELNQLMKMRANWRTEPASVCKDLVALALAGSVEPCSRLRRDGRALRYTSNKAVEIPTAEFERRIEEMCDDMLTVSSRGSGTVSLSSALGCDSWAKIGKSNVDLILFSPPYPNNIDYTEVYKLEAWFLGLIANEASFRTQRNATMRSHPSILFDVRSWPELPPGLPESVEKLAAPLMAAVPSDKYAKQRRMMISGYLMDAAVLLWRCHGSLKVGGHAVYVVGNSRHASGEDQYTIASDVLLAAVAEQVGFRVSEVKTARRLHRRGKHEHLRESVVFLERVQP